MIPSLLLLLLLESEEAVAEVLLPLPLDVARLVMLAEEDEELLELLAMIASSRLAIKDVVYFEITQCSKTAIEILTEIRSL